MPTIIFFFFFFNDTATTEIYTLSLHDALPILLRASELGSRARSRPQLLARGELQLQWRPSHQPADQCQSNAWGSPVEELDRKSTRLNSSHLVISYAVFCLKKKKKI